MDEVEENMINLQREDLINRNGANAYFIKFEKSALLKILLEF